VIYVLGMLQQMLYVFTVQDASQLSTVLIIKTMIKAIFKNHDGTTRILNWDKREGKDIDSLIHDFKAKSCEVVDYFKRKPNNK
jgi:hypothetical protein